MATRNISRRQRIKHQVRKSISGTTDRPRLTVYRSNKQFYAQLIDDVARRTITSVSSRNEKKAQNTLRGVGKKSHPFISDKYKKKMAISVELFA